MLRSSGAIAVVLAASCGGESNRPAPAPPPPPPADATAPPAAASPDRIVHGVVVLEPTVTFRPCDGGPIVSLLDSTSNRLRPAVGLGGSTEARGLFIIGVGATSPRRELILREVRYAVAPSPGEGCDRPAPDYAFGILGGDAGWQVTIRDRGIVYRDATGAETLQFAAARPAESGGALTLSTRTEFGTSHSLEIVLTPGSCRHPRSGAWSPYTASVSLDGKALQGCAWRGTL